MYRTAYAALAVAVVALCVGGCLATPIPATADSLKLLQGQTLTVVTYNPHANFVQMKVGGATNLGAVGFLVGPSRVFDLETQYDLVNPSVRVAENLIPVLSENLGPSMTNRIAHSSDGGTSLAALAQLAGNKGLVFDVDGLYESTYLPSDWSRYRIRYLGSARLVDASTRRVVAQAPCQIEGYDIEPHPTYEELYADNAALLKSKFQTAAERCVVQMGKILFGN